MSDNSWDEKALQFGRSEIGAHSDAHLVELENEFIETWLKQIKPDSILDVGCGNGRRTKRWTDFAYETIGIDSSEEMIKLAKELEHGKTLRFMQKDVRNLGCDMFDVVISTRCLINLPTPSDQIKAIDAIYRALKPEGYFICCEGREEGTTALNKLRKMFNIAPIEVMETNLDLNDKVTNYIQKLYNVVDISTLGTYYFITRVLTQLPYLNLKEAAKQLQLAFGDELGICDMGRHYCFVGRK